VEFHKHGLLLSAAVVGKYSDERNPGSPGGYDDWSGVYDYPRLARDADFLSIMAYPQHTASTGPGPLAGLPWVRRIVDFTRSAVPAQKISLGVPLYGLHWVAAAADGAPKWKGRTSLYSSTAAVIGKNPPEWREDESVYRAVFEDESGRHELWYEDARSVAAKLDLAVTEKLAGISAWALGQEDPALWECLARDYEVRHPRVRPVKGSVEERSKAAARKIAAGRK
jgi:spore germination protein YaaH